MEFLAQKADSGELLFSHEEYMTSFVTAPYEELLGETTCGCCLRHAKHAVQQETWRCNWPTLVFP